MKYAPREHQTLSLKLVAESIRRGNRKIVLYGPCSFGKTYVSAMMFEGAIKKGRKCLFIADRTKLINQAMDEFEEQGLRCGAIQGDNPRRDPDAPVQVASVQTLMRRARIPDFNFVIVDECHTMWGWILELMERWNAVVFIGLSATPYTKGMGKVYTDLVIPITCEELLEKEYLCPIKYYCGHSPDVSRVKVKVSKGIRDYDNDELKVIYEDELDVIVGDSVKEWLRIANGMQTIAFSPSIKFSQGLVERFNEAGIAAAHIDAYTKEEDRVTLYEMHSKGKIKILSCSTLLDTGYNDKGVHCLIDCSPTKSLIRYVQRGGRIQRIMRGKKHAIYMDQAGNVKRHGFIEDIVPDHLHDGEKRESERELVKKTKEKKEPIKCPCCPAYLTGLECKECGHVIKPKGKQLEVVEGSLEEVQRVTREQNRFYAGLIFYADSKGYGSGWASNKYFEKYKKYPSGKPPEPVEFDEASRFGKSRNIAYHQAKKKAKKEKAKSRAREILKGLDL